MGEFQQLFQGEIMWIALLAVLAIVVWYLTRSSSSNATSPISLTPPIALHAWPERGEYDFEVVGESKYQHVLKALRDTVPDPNESVTGTAILVPEDSNPHDNKAVKVTVQGLTIGYLSREDARSYRRRLAAMKLGLVPASCGYVITGGYLLKDGSRAHFGAQLDMKPFDN